MPPRDSCHDAVVKALIKDGWIVTHDPYTVDWKGKTLFIDLGAERMIAAERGSVRIAVEIKCFIGPSPVADFEQALGQFGLYDGVLSVVDPDRVVYLAVPDDVVSELFLEVFRELIVDQRLARVISVDLDREEIVRWIPSSPTPI